jgi:hypothetical protein
MRQNAILNQRVAIIKICPLMQLFGLVETLSRNECANYLSDSGGRFDNMRGALFFAHSSPMAIGMGFSDHFRKAGF